MADAFVCGWPITHTRSPLIHRFWLDQHGIEGTYRAIPTEAGDLPVLFDQVRRGELAGGNVTIPHKEAAFASVDARDEAAERIGAVNTVWLADGMLWGSNTDAYGFAANLDERAPGWAQKGVKALVLGAGGAARAVLHALRERGMDVSLANRTLSRAEGLAAHFGQGIAAVPWEKRNEALEGTKLVVNTTSLGMDGTEALDLDIGLLPADAVVTDIVYVPLETPLLATARARGLQTVDGLGMLLHQAVPGFERWFGVRPEVTPELRELVLADLAEAHP